MQRAFFDHPDLAISFDNLSLDFAHLLVHQVAPIFLAGDDGFTSLFDAGGTERVCLPGKAKGGFGLFPGLQERLIRPLRRGRGIGIALVEELNGVEGDTRGLAEYPVERPENLRANRIRHTAAASLSKVQATFGIPQTQTCLFETAPKAPQKGSTRRGATLSHWEYTVWERPGGEASNLRRTVKNGG